MRRDKAWWARLDEAERWKVWDYERSKNIRYGKDPYIAEDCSYCPVCGDIRIGSGVCDRCNNEYMALIAKASGGVVK